MKYLSIPYALGIFVAVLMFMLYSSPVHAFSKNEVDRYSFANTEKGVAVYTFTFFFGGYSEDLYIPVVGERNLQNGARTNRFGFTLESGYPHEVTDAGDATALLVSSAEIVDGYYRIPARSVAAFKVVGLYSVSESEANTYRLAVTELPFFVGDDREPRSFNPSELKYMKSVFEALHFKRDTE